MSESVKILIEAENKASAVIASTAKDIDAKVQAIKASGEQAKKSTEFFGTIANSLGGTELGSYASQLAGLTDKTSQFADVQKLGGAGALAFKAGLVGVVGVLAFQVGNAIGNVVFETERWTEELKKSQSESDKLLAKMIELKDFNFGRDTEEISLIRDPKERAEATAAQLAKIDNAIKDKRDSIANILKDEAKALDNDQQWGDDALGFNKARKADVAKQVADGQLLIDSLNKQAETIRRATDETALRIQATKEENALKDKSDSFLDGLKKELTLLEAIREERTKPKPDGSKSSEVQVKAQQGGAFGDNAQTEAEKLLSTIEAIKTETAKQDKSDSFLAGLRDEVALLKAKKDETFAIEAAQKTFGAEAGQEAAQLLKEKEMLIAKRDAEKKLEDDKIAKAKQVEDIRQRELDRLAEEMVLLTQGKEAARAFALEKQGLSKEDAQKIAGEQAAVDKIKDQDKPKQKASDAPTLQASESRLLTRGNGNGEEFVRATAQGVMDTVKELIQLRKEMAEDRKTSTKLKVIGKA